MVPSVEKEFMIISLVVNCLSVLFFWQDASNDWRWKEELIRHNTIKETYVSKMRGKSTKKKDLQLCFLFIFASLFSTGVSSASRFQAWRENHIQSILNEILCKLNGRKEKSCVSLWRSYKFFNVHSSIQEINLEKAENLHSSEMKTTVQSKKKLSMDGAQIFERGTKSLKNRCVRLRCLKEFSMARVL